MTNQNHKVVATFVAVVVLLLGVGVGIKFYDDSQQRQKEHDAQLRELEALRKSSTEEIDKYWQEERERQRADSIAKAKNRMEMQKSIDEQYEQYLKKHPEERKKASNK